MNWLELVKLIAPLVIAQALPKASPILPGLVTHGIEVAENAVNHKTSKLATATDAIQTSIAGINAVHPGTIDPVQVNQVLSDVISTTVDTANLVKNVPVSPSALSNGSAS